MKGAARRKDRAAAGRGFDFTGNMRCLCENITRRTSELSHVDFSRVAVSFSQARKRASHGMHASLTPMRFEGGDISVQRGGRQWTCQRLYAPDTRREYLYILSFYLPRFQDAPFREKLVTIFHELWHVSPQFNGDLRRHTGRCYAHGRSQAEFDKRCGELVDQWLAGDPPEQLYGFLRYNFQQLQDRYGQVYGLKIAAPKLIPLNAKAG